MSKTLEEYINNYLKLLRNDEERCIKEQAMNTAAAELLRFCEEWCDFVDGYGDFSKHDAPITMAYRGDRQTGRDLLNSLRAYITGKGEG